MLTVTSPSNNPMISSASVLSAWVAQVQKTSAWWTAVTASAVRVKHAYKLLYYMTLAALPEVTSTFVNDIW